MLVKEFNMSARNKELEMLLKRATEGLFTKGDAEAQFTLGIMYAEGNGVYRSEDEAYKWLKKSAEQGNKSAQFKLGLMCFERNYSGYLNDENNGYKWFQMAANQGHVEAQFKLGLMCFERDYRGYPKDEKNGYKWFQMAANQGHADAQYHLGNYELRKYLQVTVTGPTEREDIRKTGYKKAHEWFLKAAKQEHQDAQYELGDMYENEAREALIEQDEKTASQSYKIASEWFQKAVEHGNQRARLRLGVVLLVGIKDSKKALECLKIAAVGGNDAEAQYFLGEMYAEGRGVNKDIREACTWFALSANGRNRNAEIRLEQLQVLYPIDGQVSKTVRDAQSGDADAQYRLGLIYDNNLEDIEKSQKIAFEWFQKAALQGHALGQYFLGSKYAAGSGTAKDYKLAKEWLQKAASKGINVAYDWLRSPLMQCPTNASEQFKLGVVFAKGQNVAKDPQLAFQWYQKAAEQGHSDAQYALGLVFENGDGVSKDYESAKYWYQKAVISGHNFAKKALSDLLLLMNNSPSPPSNNLSPTIPQKALILAENRALPLRTQEFGITQPQVVPEQPKKPTIKPNQTSLVSPKSVEEHKIQSEIQFKPDQSQVVPAQPNIVKPNPFSPNDTKTKLDAFSFTQEQLTFIHALKTTGLQPEALLQFQKQLVQTPLFAEDLQLCRSWMTAFSSRVLQLETDVADFNRVLARDPQTRSEQAYIDKRPKLKNYQRRIEMEFNCFATCYFLAPAGIMKLDDNKKDMMISAISHIPKKTIEGIPFIGPLLSSGVGAIEEGLHSANKKHRLNQMNRVRELFKSLEHISQIAYAFAGRLALEKETVIEEQIEIQYQGLGKIKRFYQSAKKSLNQLLRDLSTSDKTGVKIKPEEELAILDCAYVFQQILSAEATINNTRDLVCQLITVITEKPYKPRTFTIATPVPAQLDATMNAHAAPLLVIAPMKTVPQSNNPSLSVEVLHRLLQEQQERSSEQERRFKEQEDALRKQREEFEAHKRAQEEESRRLRAEAEAAKEAIREQKEKAEAAEKAARALAERLTLTEKDTEKLKKEVLPEDEITGDTMSLAQLPAKPGNGMTQQSEAAQILREHHEKLRLLTEELVVVKEQQQITSRSLVQVQDRTGIDRAKAGHKGMQQAQYLESLDRKKREEEERARAAKKTEKQQQIKSGLI